MPYAVFWLAGSTQGEIDTTFDAATDAEAEVRRQWSLLEESSGGAIAGREYRDADGLLGIASPDGDAQVWIEDVADEDDPES